MITKLWIGLMLVVFTIAGTGGIANAQTTKSNKSGIYAAVGDSVAAGAGLTAVPVTQQYPNPAAGCGRTYEAYPQLIAKKTGMKFINATCSGATAGDLVTKQNGLAPQLDIAFSQGTPQLMTMTVGANDVQYAAFIGRCYIGDCATKANEVLAKTYMEAMKIKMSYAFADIQKRSNGTPPQVIVTGYYNPISNYCKGKQTYASNKEIVFLNKQRDALNKTIREAAKPYKFVKYASANFDQHGLCAKEPWTQGPTEPAPLHPTAKGQQKIADSVLGVYKR